MEPDPRNEDTPSAASPLISHYEREVEIQATKRYAGRYSLDYLRLARAKLADRMQEVDERTAEILRVRGEVIHEEILLLESSKVRAAMRWFNSGAMNYRIATQALLLICDPAHLPDAKPKP